MKKILYVATVAKHFYYFHLPSFEMFKEMGWQVDVACYGDVELPICDNQYNISIQRSPFDKKNISAYRQLKKIIVENNYDIIHCHTPMGGMLTRLAAMKSRKNGTRVIYTAHGFHFYQGAPKLNWIVYYPIEKFFSHFTDCLITINDEDYNFAIKKLSAESTKEIHGVGYNTDKYFPVSKEKKAELRKNLGFDADDKILIYVAEMNANKNQQMLINALVLLNKKLDNVKLLLVGADNYDGQNQKLVKELGLENQIIFLGHRNDIDDLLHISDIAVGSSIREGLPVNVMEALACGLPVVLSDNRGHRSLTVNGENGYIVSVNDCGLMADYIYELFCDEEKMNSFSANATELVRPYSKEAVILELRDIYNDFIG